MELLLKKIKRLKLKKKKIILCHGVFDLIHLGHIKHFKSAKNFGDFLIVSLTADKYIKKGPGRPIFNQNQRLEFLKEIKQIDEVVISTKESSEDIIKLIKPDFYVKGPDYADNKKDKTKKIIHEKKLVEKYGGKIKYTNDLAFSSSNIINSGNFIFNNEQKEFVRKIKRKFAYYQINRSLKKLKQLKVLVIGELIIDRYFFGKVLGKSGKEPHLVMEENYSEDYLGGSAAVARHLSSFVKKIDLLSPYGGEKKHNLLIKKHFKNNISFKSFRPYKNFKTIIKSRFLDIISNYKLFGSYILPARFDLRSEKIVENIIDSRKKNIDIIIVCDYGHNFIGKIIANKLKKTKKFISLNAQVNASNIGHHTIKKYKNVDVMVINESELRHELRDNNSDLKFLAKKLIKDIKIKTLVITKGKSGALLINNKNKIISCPAFAKNTVDKVGAGDAMLSILSVTLKMKIDPEIAILIASIAAAVSVESIGNKESVSFDRIDRSLEYILK